MFGAVHELLRSGRKIYFYFDKDVLAGLKKEDRSKDAEFGFLTTQPGWPY